VVQSVFNVSSQSCFPVQPGWQIQIPCWHWPRPEQGVVVGQLGVGHVEDRVGEVSLDMIFVSRGGCCSTKKRCRALLEGCQRTTRSEVSSGSAELEMIQLVHITEVINMVTGATCCLRKTDEEIVSNPLPVAGALSLGLSSVSYGLHKGCENAMLSANHALGTRETFNRVIRSRK
jgi:hypothetical protein